MPTISVFFDACRQLDARSISPLMGVCGLYFIALKRTQIPYPFGRSRLVYIGMSERQTNSIGKRLAGHYDGSSGNEGLVNYRKSEGLLLTYINFEMLRRTWPHRIEDLESYFILDFVRRYGVYPICNNKSGFEVRKLDVPTGLDIDWPHFEKEQSQDV